MPTFRYAKLVRNNIPSFHVQAGHTVKSKILTSDELHQALCEKLHEEADEVSGALSRDELIEEIADVKQILDDLCATSGISESELKDVQQDKAERKGGFDQGQFIDTVTMPNEDDRWVEYCRQSPEKYPEIVT